MSKQKILTLIQMCPLLLSNICFYICFLCSVWHRYIYIAHYLFLNKWIFFEYRTLAKVKYSINSKILNIEFFKFLRFIFESFSYLYPYWSWSTEWSREKSNRVLPRESDHSKHPLPTTKEKTLHMDITRWSTPKLGWL